MTRRPKRRTVVLLGLALGAAGGVTVSAGLSARAAAQDLRAAQDVLTSWDVDRGSTEDALRALREARPSLLSARSELEGWPVDVVAAVPVLGRSWEVERQVARTGSGVVDAALVLAGSTAEMRARDGGLDLAAVQQVGRDLQAPARRARAAFDRLQELPVGLVPPPVGRARASAERALGPAVATLTRTSAGLGVVPDLLGQSGSRSVLVALQNNAELRGAGGYVSTFATGQIEDGRLSLAPLQDLIAVADPPGRARRVPAPAEYAADYGPLQGDTTQFRSWNMSPHVPDSAVVGSRIAGALLGTAPDVVVLLDVPAMGALAALGGAPLVLPDGGTVAPADLTEALLVEAYQAAGTDGDDQVRRRAQLRAAATAAVSRLLTAEVPATDLLRTLSRLAAGRHLSVWSAVPSEQAALEAAGVAGAVTAPAGGDLSHVSLNNLGANKLDTFVDREVEVEVAVTPDAATVAQRVRLTNAAPEGLVPYVAGTSRPGVMTARAELSLPPAATRIRATVDGRPWPQAVRAGQHRSRLVTRVQLPRGRTTVLEVHYVLPLHDATYRLRLVPQPLAEDARLSLTVLAPDGRLTVLAGPDADAARVDERAVVFDRTQEVAVRVDRSLWERLRDFWSSPVELG